jgi:hypothetical protein
MFIIRSTETLDIILTIMGTLIITF